MTLNRRLWLAIVLILILAFAGTFAVSTWSAKIYMEQQLRVKNLDNATSLALSMSQMPKDMVTLELLLAAQFDAGHYRLIRLTDPQGDVLIERTSLVSSTQGGAPSWFVSLFPIDVPPGVAQIQDGWRQFGTLHLNSHDRFAYASLWQGSRKLLFWFLAVALLSCLMGSILLRAILKPLTSVVEQAEAIGERQFVITREPATVEFRRLVRAMNTLSGRVREMLSKESGRVEELLRKAQCDPVTGLVARKAFMDQLDSALGQDTKQATGVLVILRLESLEDLNRQFGHAATDELLARLGDKLNSFAAQRSSRWSAGRLGGTDIALLAPGETDVKATAQLFAAEVTQLLSAGQQASLQMPAGASSFRPGETRAQLLSRVDTAVTQSQETGRLIIKDAECATDTSLPTDLSGWRGLLERSLQPESLKLQPFPVLSASGELVHQQCPARLRVGGEDLPAGFFVAWVARLGWSVRMDKLVVDVAMQQIEKTGGRVAINLSTEAICDLAFTEALVARLQQQPDIAAKLCLDIAEHGALHHLAEFRSFCMALKPLHCGVGLKHAGPDFARIAEMHDLGLSYLKLDASLSSGIANSADNQSFIRGVCTLVHSVGLHTIAEGVANEQDRACLISLGVDALTGPIIRLS